MNVAAAERSSSKLSTTDEKSKGKCKDSGKKDKEKKEKKSSKKDSSSDDVPKSPKKSKSKLSLSVSDLAPPSDDGFGAIEKSDTWSKKKAERTKSSSKSLEKSLLSGCDADLVQTSVSESSSKEREKKKEKKSKDKEEKDPKQSSEKTKNKEEKGSKSSSELSGSKSSKLGSSKSAGLLHEMALAGEAPPKSPSKKKSGKLAEMAEIASPPPSSPAAPKKLSKSDRESNLSKHLSEENAKAPVLPSIADEAAAATEVSEPKSRSKRTENLRPSRSKSSGATALVKVKKDIDDAMDAKAESRGRKLTVSAGGEHDGPRSSSPSRRHKSPTRSSRRRCMSPAKATRRREDPFADIVKRHTDEAQPGF